MLAVAAACLTGIGAASAASTTCTNPGPPCVVNIVVDEANCQNSRTDFDEVHFPPSVRGNPNRKIRIQWRLPPGSPFGFCGTSGDGPFLKDADPDHQFEPKGFGPPAGGAACNRKVVTWEAQNTRQGRRFPYGIRFHSQDGGKQCMIDPVMIND